MAKPSRDTGLSLIQHNPSRDLLLQKMRGKLATTPSAPQAETARKRDVRRRTAGAWSVRLLVLAGFVGLNYFAFGHRDLIASKLGRRAVPVLPDPGRAYSPDQQALYYVYALYDYPRLQETFGLQGFLAVDQAEARRRLDDLLPQVGPQTLGEISKYMPVAFRKGPPGLAKGDD